MKTRPAKRAKRKRPLTSEESKQLKNLLVEGYSIPEISEKMNRSNLSIRCHTVNLVKRYNVKNRFQLITHLLKNEILN